MKPLFFKATGGLLYVFAIVSALIFLPAWTFDYWQAWVFLAVLMSSMSVVFLYLARFDPALLARRVKTEEKEMGQKLIRLVINLAFSTALVVSSLDHRLRWSPIRIRMVFAGDALVFLAFVVIFFVFRENTFTSQTVEVEAGQQVISTGPYAFVRHPMYVGGLIFMLAIPLALGSLWGLLAVVPFSLALSARIGSEERLLSSELRGYEEYRSKVPYRLVPFVW
jgi:protein-S-isoprenylcysteine O-methyltransferase Ste14